MSEADIQARIMLAIGALPGVRLFRNNTGQAWQGKVVSHEGGLLVLRQARPITFGLCVGSPDLIGWRSVEITPEWVGRRVALFLAPEVKTLTGPSTEKQRNFIKQATEAGALAGVVRSAEDAAALVSI